MTSFFLDNNKDKFGYYTVGDFKTYSKMEAIELADQLKKLPRWHFNDLEYSSYNWTVEPVETLKELYARRAREIREKYDHVVIFYSGGIDSENIVDTFVENNIPFDELATMNYFGLDSRPDTYFHAEQTKVSFPKIRSLKEKGIDFLHRAIDLSEIAHDILTDSSWNLKRAYYGNSHSSTMHLAKTFIRERTRDYLDLIEQGKKLVFVWGADKPRLKRDRHNRLVVQFADYISAAMGTRTQIENRPWEHDELFYWDPSCCDLICKQIHTVRRFVEKFPSLKLERITSDDPVVEPDLLAFFKSKGITAGLKYVNIVNWLVYPNFQFDMFTVGKPGLFTVYSQRDESWTKDNLFRVQHDFLAQHYRGVPLHWLRDAKQPCDGLKTFYTSHRIEC